MKFSVSSSATALIANDTREQIEAFCEVGIKHIDFDFTTSYYNPDHKPCDDETFVFLTDLAKETAKKNNVDFPMAHAPYLWNSNASEENFSLQVKDVSRAIKGCKMLGIDRITVHGGNAFCSSHDELIDKNIAYFKALLPVAEEYGVTLMIENISELIYGQKFAIQTAEDILQVRQGLNNHPLIRACWDTGHANLAPYDQYENLMLLGENVFALHMHDNLGNTDSHMPPLMGTVNFDDVIKALKDIKYSGPFNFESQLFRAGYEWPNYTRDYNKTADSEKLLWVPDRTLVMSGLILMRRIGEYMLDKYGIESE